ncbi:MAG: T9SS type A sorting domain-containing protein, partial [Bacteroidales bacterium]|nr:T9SS type A sorting domain-containing protein [Bacteroidales bacterium]
VFPNPVVDYSVIGLNLPDSFSGTISVAIFDRSGKFVKEFENEYTRGGLQEMIIPANDLLPGLYFYEVFGDGFSKTKTFIKI